MITISVIMGIYNCASTLEEAINSIVNQTFTDWELIMCDDGSKDLTCAVAEKYCQKYPEKIVLLRNSENKGLNYTLNRCLAIANGKYIARMDGDDRCHPERFEIELETLEKNKEIAIVSCDMGFFDEKGTWGRISHPTHPVYKDFIHESPFCHAPCMVRKEAFLAVKGYSESSKLLRVEDYHLWMKLYKAGYKGENIHTILYEMRDDRDAYNRRKFKYRINEAYVKLLIIREFKLPLYNFVFVLRPIIVGLIPKCMYDFLHKRRLGNMK